MPITPEELARQKIDKLLTIPAGSFKIGRLPILQLDGVWQTQSFRSKSGTLCRQLLYVDGIAGIVEAKKEDATLTGVDLQTKK